MNRRPGALGRAALAAASALALLVATADSREVPFLAGHVNDLAELLSPTAEATLEERLVQLEQQTAAQVAVLTIPSLEGEVLEDYSLRVAETWKLGRGEFDDGVLLLIARDERKMRLEVGYGLEGTIPDVYAKRILDDILRPSFRAGDFDGGVESAVDAIAGLIRGDASLPPPADDRVSSRSDPDASGWFAFLIFLVTVGLFSLQALTAPGCVGWFLYLFLMPFWALFPLVMLGRPLGLLPIVLWIVGFPLLRRIFHRTRTGRRWRDTALGPFFGSGGGWSSSGGGWGGGFSGGGGSFGGGGASGSW